MAAAGLADVISVQAMVIFASVLLIVGSGVVLLSPALGLASLRATSRRLRAAAEAPGLAQFPSRLATLADFDRMVGRLTTFGRLTPEQRSEFVRAAVVRDVPAGTRIVEHGDTASNAYFILDGSTTAGIPDEDGYRGLSTMGPGDFFGEIAALTGSPRTADVVADTDTTLLEVPASSLRAAMVVPEISKLVLTTLATRVQRTESADLPRLAGLDQDALKDLRTVRPATEALPLVYDADGGVA